MGRECGEGEKEDGAHVEAEEFVDVGDDVVGELLVVVAGEYGDDGDADVGESKFDEEGQDGDEDDEKQTGQLVPQSPVEEPRQKSPSLQSPRSTFSASHR